MRRSLAVVLLPALVAVQGCPPDHAPPGECTNWNLSNPHTITITNPGLDTLLVVRGARWPIRFARSLPGLPHGEVRYRPRPVR